MNTYVLKGKSKYGGTFGIRGILPREDVEFEIRHVPFADLVWVVINTKHELSVDSILKSSAISFNYLVDNYEIHEDLPEFLVELLKEYVKIEYFREIT